MAADPAVRAVTADGAGGPSPSFGSLGPDPFRAVALQTASGMAWTGVAMLLGFAVKVLMTRKMLPRDMGIVLTAQAFAALAGAVATLGVPDAIVRLVGIHARGDAAPKLLVRVGVRTAVVATGAAAAIALAALVVAPLTSPDAWWAAVIFTMVLPAAGMGEVLGAAYRGIGRFATKLVLVDVLRPLLVVVALLLSPVVLTRRAPYVAALFAVSTLGSLAAIWITFRGDGRWRSGDTVTVAELLRFGVPMAATVLLAGPIINNVLPLMISAWTDTAAVAFYAVAISIYGLVYLPVGVLEQAVTPSWAHMVAHDTSEALARSFQRYTSLCFSGAAGLALVAMANDGILLTTVFGPPFEAAGGAVRVAIAAAMGTAATGPNEAMLHALGRSRSIFTARLAGAMAGVGVGLIVIPAYGLMGGISAFAVTTVGINGLYGAMLYRQTGISPFTWRQAGTIAVAAIGVLAATVMVNAYPVAGRVTATIIGIAIVAAQPDMRAAARHLLRL